jgi:transcriptional regulator with XRE-family HTH domain
MRGTDLPAWRKRNGGYTQEGLQKELGIKSRGTISRLENSDDELSRLYLLALLALECLPELRNIAGFEKNNIRQVPKNAGQPSG